MSVIKNKAAVKIGVCISLIFIFFISFSITCYAVISFVSSNNTNARVSQQTRLNTSKGPAVQGRLDSTARGGRAHVSSDEPAAPERPSYALEEQRILDSFAISTIPGTMPKLKFIGQQPHPSMYEPYYTNPSGYYGHQVLERLEGIGYSRVAECNPTVNTWYFTGSPDYLLVRKFSPEYNVALSFTWLLTEQQRFFKCTVKFELPENFEHDDGFQFKTDPLKKIDGRPYADTAARDLREILTAMAFADGSDCKNMLYDKNDFVLFENVITAFKKNQQQRFHLKNLAEIRFFADMDMADSTYPVDWLWVFLIGYDSVTVYSGQAALLKEESYVGPQVDLLKPTLTNMPGFFNFPDAPPRIGPPEPEHTNPRYQCPP
jgi:hypothetical protein